MQWLLILLRVEVTLLKCPHDVAPIPLGHITGHGHRISPALATFSTVSLIGIDR